MAEERGAFDILQRAQDEICDLACRVGIDGQAFLESLPPPGTLLTGRSVPVLTRRDLGKVSILFHVNQTKDGRGWPFIKFHSFRHGGLSEQFNGLQWLRRQAQCDRIIAYSNHRPLVVKQATRHFDQGDGHRRQRDEQLQFSYQRARPLTEDLPWVASRFHRHITSSLIGRTSGRHDGSGRMLFPMYNLQGKRTGFHQIVTANGDEKRHFVRRSGLMAGSVVRIKPESSSSSALPAIICEGVATAMTIALLWPGPIFAALSANNLKSVRKAIYGPVILAADNDQWKPEIGNIGVAAAYNAAESGDTVLVPRFRQTSHAERPTDYNDLLKTEGYIALRRQLGSTLMPTTPWYQTA